jgi:hypothetical protein
LKRVTTSTGPKISSRLRGRRVDVDENGRADGGRPRIFPSVQQQRAFGFAAANKLWTLSAWALSISMPMVVSGRADCPAASVAPALSAGQELVGDALLQQQAGAGDTHLPLVIENAAGGGADRFCRSGQSAKTMLALLPPASSQTRFILLSPRLSAAACRCGWSR